MNSSRRSFLQLTMGAAALPATARIARSQAYPTRPVHLLVGFPPAGSNDITARLIGQWLSMRLASNSLSRSGRARALPLPQNWSFVHQRTGTHSCWLDQAMPGTRPFTATCTTISSHIVPVASISRGMGALVVHPSVPARSLAELIDYAKANPGKLTVASAGIGSGPHMYWELFRSMTGVNMLHVPYRGGGPAITDLLGGQVQIYFSTLISSIQYIRDGKLRPLAVTAARRADVLPDVPTMGELVQGYDASTWFGMGGPRNTPVLLTCSTRRLARASPIPA